MSIECDLPKPSGRVVPSYCFPNTRMIIEWMGTASSKPGDHKSKMGGVTLTWKWGGFFN
jgi:hypothetical protein